MAKQLFFVDPPLGGDELLSGMNALSIGNRKVSYVNDEDVYFQEKAGKILLAKGASQIIAESGLQTEATLPAGIPASQLADTVRYLLHQVNARNELLIIDPYFFPKDAPTDYLQFVEHILATTLDRISHLYIVTMAKRNVSIEGAFKAMVTARNAAIVQSVKYTNKFHDRFWIGDSARGLFIGTSLNGIGNRYSLADYLRDEDVTEIYAVFQSLP